MPNPGFTLGSPSVLQFLNLTEKDVNPNFRSQQIQKTVDRFSTGDNVNYENTLIKQGVNPETFKFLSDYIEFEPSWKTSQSIQAINSLSELVQTNPNPLYSYNLKEGPLYRGTKLDKGQVPGVGQELSFERFRSFSPDINIAGPFVNEGAPLDFGASDEEFKKQLALEKNKQKVLFQVQSDSPGDFKYFITPDAGEPEVLSRPGAKYLVTDKQTFPFYQRGMTGDIDFIKLQQLYGMDPVGSAIQGGKNLIKENIPGAAFGAALSALNPEVTQAIKKDKYTQAAGAIGRDVLLGAVAEAGLKTAGKYAPLVNNIVTPLTRVVSPVVTGAALFAQGQPGSLTDVLTTKAAQNPIGMLPSVKANPQTDLGARASRAVGNEARYAWQQLLRGKIPYSK